MLSKLRRLLVTFILGTLFCMNPFTALAVMGWTYRAMRCQAFRYWGMKGTSAATGEKTLRTELAPWPGWLCAQRNVDGKGFRALLRRGFGGIGLNIQRGVEGFLTTMLLTLPIFTIWMVMWWAGWIVSFHKSYEESVISTVASVVSVAVFALVMLYLPMAQARHAVTGEWRSFFDFRLVRILTRHARFRLILLTALYCIGAVGVMFGKDAIRVFIENIVGFDTRETDALKGAYVPVYVLTVALFFAGFLLLRMLHARIYASAVLKALAAGDVPVQSLSVDEQVVLKQLGLAEKEVEKTRSVVTKSLAWFMVLFRTFLTVAAQCALWLLFAFIVYVGQFLDHGWYEWILHPLVHQPFIGFYFGDTGGI